MTRAPLSRILRVRPDESGAIQIGTIKGKVADAGSRAAQVIRTYYLTDEIRSHMRKILTSIARGNAPSPGNLEYNAWLLDAGIGAGKSHFLAFLMVLLAQKDDAWQALMEKEEELGTPSGRRLDEGVIFNSILSKQHLVVPIDLTGEPTARSLSQILVTHMKAVFEREAGNLLPVEPDERLIDWLYQSPLLASFQAWLRDRSVDERKESIYRKNASSELTALIREYCALHQIEPHINASWDQSLRLGCGSWLSRFDGGTVLIVDELSRYMARRKQAGQDEDDIATLQLIARNFREEGIQVWLVATENVATSKEVTRQIKGPGTMEPLTLNTQDFRDIVLYRCRALPEDPKANEAARAQIEVYWTALKPKLHWVRSLSLEDFVHVFPFEPTLIDLTRRVCNRIAETRTGIQILHSVLRRSLSESCLITADMVFDELEGKVGQEGAKANLFEETEENRTIYRVYLDILDQIGKSGEVPEGFKPKAVRAVKALVIFYLAEREEFVSPEDILEILSEEWSDTANRSSTLIHFTGVLDRLPTVSQGHIEKDKGGYRFSVEGQVSIKPDWEGAIADLQKPSGAYSPLKLLRQLIASEPEIQDSFFGGLPLDSGVKTLSYKSFIWKGFAVKGVGRLIDVTQTSTLDPPNKRDQNQDFALYVALLPDAAKGDALLSQCQDERVILWVPKALSPGEVSDLLAYEALLNIRKRYARGEHRDDAEKLSKADTELADRKPAVINTVKAAFNHGTLRTKTQILNVGKADLQTALTAAVPLVLDDAYRQHTLAIPGNQPLDEAGILKLANGLIRHERYRDGIPKDEWDAAKAFARPLELASNAATPELDISGSSYVARIKRHIEDNGGSIAFSTLKESYGDKPHGLSQRLLSLYLLAMARKAEVVLEAKPGTVSKNVIESGLTFKSGSGGYIDEIRNIHRSKAPEPWDKILEAVNVLLGPEPASPQRSDENYARIARDVQKAIAAEAGRWETWKPKLEAFAAGVGAGSSLPAILEQLAPVLSLADLEKNPSEGLEALWNAVQSAWGDSPRGFADAFFSYRKVREFLTLRKDEIVLLARRIAMEIPGESEGQWAELRQALDACEAAFRFDEMICDDSRWEVYHKAQKKLHEAYASAYTGAHAAYYQAIRRCREDLSDLRDSEEMACLVRLESVPEIGGGAGERAKREIEEALQQLPDCSRVLDSQLRSAVRCACGFGLTDQFASTLPEDCLERIDEGLRLSLAVLQSPDIKNHLLASEGAGSQPGLSELLGLPPRDTKRLTGIASPDLVEWLRQALSGMRSVEVDFDTLPIPASFPYQEADAVAEALKTHLRRRIEESIDRSGYRKEVETGKSVVVRVKI